MKRIRVGRYQWNTCPDSSHLLIGQSYRHPEIRLATSPCLNTIMLMHRLVGIILTLTTGCTGTRLYQRAESRAAKGDLDAAMSYDMETSRTGRVLPHDYPNARDARVEAWTAAQFAKAGPVSSNNVGDAYHAAVHAKRKLTEFRIPVPPSLNARLAEIAAVRFARVRALAADRQFAEGVALASQILAAAPSLPALQQERDALAKHGAEHYATAARASKDPSVIAWFSDVALLTNPAADVAAFASARSQLARDTSIGYTVEPGKTCADVITKATSSLPLQGTAAARVTFDLTGCSPHVDRTTWSETRYRNVEEWQTIEYQEVESTRQCVNVPSTSTSCSLGTYCQGASCGSCFTTTTTEQSCSNVPTVVSKTKRELISRQVPYLVQVNHVVAELTYRGTVSLTIDGKKAMFDVAATGVSVPFRAEDSEPDAEGARQDALLKASNHLAAQLAQLVGAARGFQAERLERTADAALQAGDAQTHFGLYLQASYLRRRPSSKVIELATAANVSPAVLTAVFAAAPVVLPELTGHGELAFPAPPRIEEIREDADETIASISLSPNRRAAYQSAFALGTEAFRNNVTNATAYAFSFGGWGAGALPALSDYTCVGGAAHALGQVGQTKGGEVSIVMGFGAKVPYLCVMPVSGARFGYATHSDSEAADFLPEANIRPSLFDVQLGGQATLSLPRPLNVVINARALRTVPVGLETAPAFFGTHYEASLGWQARGGLVISLMLRHSLFVDKAMSQWDAWGDGRDAQRSATTIHLGIGGGGAISPFGKKVRGEVCDLDLATNELRCK